MPVFRIVGDTLTAFGIDIELPEKPDFENDDIRKAIADEIGLERYLREEDFRIDNVAELDANGNELPATPPAPTTP